MMRGCLILITAAVAALSGSLTAVAHHSFAAEYDATRPIDLSGVVTEMRWVNPHSWLFLDVQASDGGATHWRVEFGAPNALEDRGLKKEYLQPGTHVHIRGFRSKKGGTEGYSVTLSLRDGRTFKTGGVDCPQIDNDQPLGQRGPTFLGPPRH
jgi:hypothetical protein